MGFVVVDPMFLGARHGNAAVGTFELDMGGRQSTGSRFARFGVIRCESDACLAVGRMRTISVLLDEGSPAADVG
jgi:hypothetical protein